MEENNLEVEEESESSSSEDKEDFSDNVSSVESFDNSVSDVVDVPHEVASGHRILKEIIKQNKSICWPFMDKVDVKGLQLWDYPEKVKEPMWLNKIKEKFADHIYNTFAEFAKDFRLMVENCYRYNSTDHPISKKAKRLEKFFEGKLALLSRDIRESCTLAITSNRRFATPDDEIATSRSGRISTNSFYGGRDYESGFDSQARLVYDFVRCEELAVVEDERQSSYREKRQQQTLYQQIAAVFIDSLESKAETKLVKTCPYLPEIALFLHINQGLLRLPDLAMYNLEMSLLIPQDSLYLAKIMTSFLCSYYEKSMISQRPPMRFKTWENRLRSRVTKWFDTASKQQSYEVAADKLFINLEFFREMKWRNPFVIENSNELKSFTDLSYFEKALILKALCGYSSSLQSIQNNIAALPCEESRPMTLGVDIFGNMYIYFPQFCGNDVRVYRHRQHAELPEFLVPIPDLPRQKEVNGKLLNDDLYVDSPLSEIKVDNSSPSCNFNSEIADLKLKEENDSNSCKDESEIELNAKKTLDNLVNCVSSEQDIVVDDFESTNLQTKSTSEQQSDKTEEIFKETEGMLPNDLDIVENSEKMCSDNTENNIKNDTETNTNEPKLDVSLTESKNIENTEFKDKELSKPLNVEQIKSEPVLPSTAPDLLEENKSDLDDSQISVDKVDSCLDEDVLTKKSVASSSSRNTRRKKSGVKDEVKNYSPSTTPKKSKTKCTLPAENSPVRRSLRKRAAVNYSTMVVTGSNEMDEGFQEKSETPKKKPTRSTSRKRAKKVVEPEEPDEEYGNVDFETVCDSVETLKKLVKVIEDQKSEAVKLHKSKVVKTNIANLYDQLQWLVGELSEYETKLEKARFDAKLRLKREHDEILHNNTTGRRINNNVDPWEGEQLSKNSIPILDATSSSTPSSSTYHPTPPTSIYAEEESEESEPEVRRTKRKPKRYEEDEDFVVESSEDNSPLPYHVGQFLYDEFDEVRIKLVPAALEELYSILQNNSTDLHKMLGQDHGTKDEEKGVVGERRTRQKSKKENRVFRKVLYFSAKNVTQHPSLLPLLRSDQSEISEIVDRVLAQEAVARLERKAARQEELKRKREARLEAQLEAKKARTAERLSNRRRRNVVDYVTSNNGKSSWEPPASSTKAENVMVRYKNGKIGQAIRFSDGRVAPISRVDDSYKPPPSMDALKSTFSPKKKLATANQVPHISLTGRRRSVVNILKRASASKPVIPPTSSAFNETSESANKVINIAEPKSQSGFLEASVTQNQVSLAPIKITQTPPSVSRPPVSSNVAQRVTLPSGQVISLVLPMQKRQPGMLAKQSNPNQVQNKVALSVSQSAANTDTISLNKSEIQKTISVPIVQNAPYVYSSGAQAVSNLQPQVHSHSNAISIRTTPTKSILLTSTASPNAIPRQSILLPSSSLIPTQQSNVHDNKAVNSISQVTSFHSNKPMGIVSPIKVQQPQNRHLVTSQPSFAVNIVQNQQLQQQGVIARPMLQPVTYLAPQVYNPAPVQILPAGSISYVQPQIQIVQTVPLQVQNPVMYLAPRQATMPVNDVVTSQHYHVINPQMPNALNTGEQIAETSQFSVTNLPMQE